MEAERNWFTNWCLVCHSCKKIWPSDTAISVRHADCCADPDLHVHDLNRPCDLCKSSGEEGNANVQKRE